MMSFLMALSSDLFSQTEKGEIYKAHYKGKYCTPCESFWTDEQLVDGKCPDCGSYLIQVEGKIRCSNKKCKYSEDAKS